MSDSRRPGSAAAIVLAGGSGTRVGAGENKVYLPLAGRPMLAWSLRAFVRAPDVGPVLLVARAGDEGSIAALLATEPGFERVEVVRGGPTRQASELAGLRRLADRIETGGVDVVLVHDGARPLVDAALVAVVLQTARRCGGAIPALPRDDLAALGPDGTSVGPAPAGLVAVQTPQGFRAGPLLAAYELAEAVGFVGTDTASCVQRFAPELEIRAVAGEGRNIKVTYPHDLPVAARVLAGHAAGEPPSPPAKPAPTGG